MTSKKAAWFALIVLFAINLLNFFDRNILGAIGEPVRKELDLSDASLGLLQTAFTLFYAVIGLPFGWMADKFDRRRVLAIGVFAWSLITSASGFAASFRQLFVLRLGVGVGEASCAPAATSLIGDLFPSKWRARAMSVFMLGLPVGIALSYAVSGTVTKYFGWRAAFFVAGIPGIAVAIAVLFIREPERGSGDSIAAAVQNRSGSRYWRILTSPTMVLIIISGAIHNFNLYAISAFVTPYLMRYHNADIQTANYVTTAAFGLMGAPGLLLGGYIGDMATRWRTNGRMLVPTGAIALSIPLLFFGLNAGRGEIALFAVLMGSAFALMYFYYSCVYSSIHDIFEPGLRGTAMAVYFMAFYILGGSLGPYVTGLLSDLFTRRAAMMAGVTETTAAALEPFKADGLHSAMFIVPALSIVLALVLLAASKTITREINDLQRWLQAGGNSDV